MGVDRQIEENLKVVTLKAIEQRMDKIAGIFDQYTAKIGQELASINQKLSYLESRIDNLEKVSPPTIGARKTVALQTQPETITASELKSPASYTITRQPARRNLQPATFVSGEDTTGRRTQREEFREYRPVRGGIVEEKHVKVSVFSRELDRRREAEAASATPPEGRTVVISHRVREDTATSPPMSRPVYTQQQTIPEASAPIISSPGYTQQETVPESRAELEDWLHKTETSFTEMPTETRRDVMPHYTQLKLFLCKNKKAKDSACIGCLIQNTIDCPLFKPTSKT